MKTLSKAAAQLALVATIVAPVLFAAKVLAEAPMKTTLLAAAIVWFAAAPFWLRGGAS